jgi:hypothetical protein
MKTFLITLLSLLALVASAQTYSIDWHKIAGGGGTSTGGLYSISGTLGQHDASDAKSGGNYSITGGYWALINVVLTPGVTPLLIVPNGANSVKILWPDPATNTYTLQQSANLAPSNGWATSGYAITPANGKFFLPPAKP